MHLHANAKLGLGGATRVRRGRGWLLAASGRTSFNVSPRPPTAGGTAGWPVGHKERALRSLEQSPSLLAAADARARRAETAAHAARRTSAQTA
jgi:hypothetical protein